MARGLTSLAQLEGLSGLPRALRQGCGTRQAQSALNYFAFPSQRLKSALCCFVWKLPRQRACLKILGNPRSSGKSSKARPSTFGKTRIDNSTTKHAAFDPASHRNSQASPLSAERYKYMVISGGTVQDARAPSRETSTAESGLDRRPSSPAQSGRCRVGRA